MTRPTEPIVRAVLLKRDRGLRIQKAILAAWDTCKEKYPDRAWWRRKSTRAAVVWEHAVDNLIAMLQDDPGVVVHRHYDTVSFIFDDTVLLRIKKADIELMSSNVQTELASLFHDHEADLFGYVSLQRIEATYVLNQFETDITWVGIVARESRSQLFHFQFDELSVPIKTPTLFPLPRRTSPADLATPKRVPDGAKKPEGQGE
jgi:hypothetical protein